MTIASAPPRVPGLYGRRPPKHAPAIPLSTILTGTVPAYPVSVDHLTVFPTWQMLGNDRAGDCVAVTWANVRRLVSTVLGTGENYPSQDYVWRVYRTQNPDFDPNGPSTTTGPGSPADRGMDIQTLLEYLVKTGGPDGVKAVAFARVAYTNLAEVKAAIAIFGSVWVGFLVNSNNQQEFSQNQPWDYDPNSPLDGGHSVIAGGYHGQVGDDERFITWAAETTFTDACWAHQVEEAWVVIWPEHFGQHAFLQGVDQAALVTAYHDITGKTLPVPAPPQPVNLDAAVNTFWNATRHWATAEHHVGDNAKAAAAARALFAAAHLT